MKIGIDAQQLSYKKKTGVEHLISQLVLEMKKIDYTNSYYLFTNQTIDNKYSANNFKIISLPFFKFWHLLRLPLALLEYRVDIFIESVYMLPFFSPKNSICFIHDMAVKYYPDSYTFKERYLLNKTYSRALKAKHLICISQNTKLDFCKFYPNYSGNIHVIYPGYDNENYRLIDHKKKIIKDKYILFVGRLERRKNIVNLILAYNKFCYDYGFDYKLVLAGGKGFGYLDIEKTISELDKKVQNNIALLGYVSKSDLPDLYAGSSLFIFPSLYEGFGIPVLEAMASGVPVACSNASSIPEVGGNAVEYFDPKKSDEISNSIKKILSDNKYQAELIRRGLLQAKKFSYQKMAEEVLKIINSFE